MDRVVNFSGVFLWAMVFMTAAFSYTAINYSNDLQLKDLCVEGEHSPQSMLDSELVQLLSDLNELRMTGKDNNTDDLKWIDSCAGWIIVELRSRSFEKKLQNPQIK